jgi:hypothetical protein
MALTGHELELSLRIVRSMLSKGVVGKRHHQPQTVAGWFAVHERGDVKQTIDSMVSDRDVPLRQTGRGTVQLTGVPEAKQYLEDNGEEPPSRW